MRIALVAPFGLRAKGTSRARALPLARELARRGHTAALFIPPYDSPEDSGRRWIDEATEAQIGQRGASAGVEVINIALPALGRGSAIWHLWLGWRLFRAVRAWRPDVVHVFKPKGPSGLVGTLLWATRGGRSRSVVSPRLVSLSTCLLIIDSDDWEGPGGWNDDPRAGYSPLQRRFFAWQERYGLSHADAWTVTSACLRERAVGFGADPDRIFTLHNGIAVSSDWGSAIGHQPSAIGHQPSAIGHPPSAIGHQPSAIGHPPSAIGHQPSAIGHQPSAILYTRFAGVRPADVAAIWAQVRARAPAATLTVVGRGLGGEERELAGLPGIQVQGWAEPAEMPALFARMAVAVAPWADTPSNRARHSAKVLELMTAGLPVVAYAVGELPATLGDAGVLAPPGDADAFAAAVVALMADPDRAARLGAAAQARVRVEFTWARQTDAAIAAYAAAGAGVG